MPSPLRFTVILYLALHLSGALPVLADGPADNHADHVRPIPPPGIEVPPPKIQHLQDRVDALRVSWEKQVNGAKNDTARERLLDLESEVLVFPRSVELAIEFDQFYHSSELVAAEQLLDEAGRRIEVIDQGGDWVTVVGLESSPRTQRISGGFRSKIDGSFQPYGIVIPAGFQLQNCSPRRLDVWLHGRGERASEVAFLRKHRTDEKHVRPGNEPVPQSAIVLHPYGRYSNAFKFAGEIDVLEAIDYLHHRMSIDPDRIAIRGFSMGGAGCWQLATHYADQFFVATPGAGFSETPEFLKSFQGEDARATAPDYQQTLWQLYDCPPWAENLKHCPTIAYSGELDRQKQAADVMQAALSQHGIDLVHLIGPETAHKIHPQQKREIEERVEDLESLVSNRTLREVHLTTMTLRYHQMHWLDVQGLKQHWNVAKVDAVIDGGRTIRVTTQNVSRLRLNFNSGQWPGDASGTIRVVIDGKELRGPMVRSDRSWTLEMAWGDQGWKVAQADTSLRKRPGLQGPIDDALMDRFVFVLPSGKSKDPVVEEWIGRESHHAREHWRKHFRGDIRSVLDTEVDEAMLRNAHLILFGDRESNQWIAKLLPELPITWSANKIQLGHHEVPSAGHVPVLIYPNPQNPERYIVINSGFTFRSYDYLNNARQVPKLPDWALIDVRNGSTTRDPGEIQAAGFFDEFWQPRSNDPLDGKLSP